MLLAGQKDATARAAEFWNNAQSPPDRTRWWTSPTIIRHVNQRVCGSPIDGLHSGFHRRLAAFGPFKKAVSVGCGNGTKEINLVVSGHVEEFHLFEISCERLRMGQANAQSHGLSDRVHFHLADAFDACTAADFDLVYWNNALHHMMDTTAAVEWSRDRLKSGGVFAMDDFVGPSRFQWTDLSLEIASKFREALPPQFLKSPTETGKNEPTIIRRPSLEGMIKADPSEAADSYNIVPAVRKVFPDSEIVFTGGAIYHRGLNNILANFEEESPELRLALVVDDALSAAGENHYAVAFATRRP